VSLNLSPSFASRSRLTDCHCQEPVLQWPGCSALATAVLPTLEVAIPWRVCDEAKAWLLRTRAKYLEN